MARVGELFDIFEAALTTHLATRATDDVKPLVLGLLEQISGLTARVEELLAQNKALLARIAELEAEPASRRRRRTTLRCRRRAVRRRTSRSGGHGSREARKGHPGVAASAARTRTRHATSTLSAAPAAPRSRGRPGTREGLGPCGSAADQADHDADQAVPRRLVRCCKARVTPSRPPTCPRARRSAPA